MVLAALLPNDVIQLAQRMLPARFA